MYIYTYIPACSLPPRRVATLRALCGDDFMLLSGEDSNAFEFTLLGGDGVISVTSNVAPAQQVTALCIYI